MPTVSVPRPPELTDSQRAVLDAVRAGFDSPSLISGETGLVTRQVADLLAQLVEAGLLTKTGAGKAVSYTVTARAAFIGAGA